ncbi:LapA family protein [uncultured Enterovirga sp.]|uniref:LapA family protein n=1 Tax=uncultured Enterovirga sp. TaxID=2026352 RepID=UPI0035CBA5D0
MLAALKALLLLPVALVVILLSVANRAPVTFSLDPFAKGPPDLALTVPLYAIVLAALALGILIGGMGAWLAAGRDRRSSRTSRREVNRLKSEADRLRASLATNRGNTLPAPRSPA